MTHALRLLGALALLVALTPLAIAQPIDCDDVPLSTGAPDPAYAVCAEPMVPVVPEGPTDTAFGINNAAAAFQRFQQNMPGTLSTVGPYTPPGGAFLNAGDYEGGDLSTWYGVDNQGQAIAVNPSTGAVTQLGMLPAGITAVTYDHDTAQFYATQVPSCGLGTLLLAIDFQALSATPIGGTDLPNACAIGLAAHPTTGVLYSYDLVNDQLRSISKVSGQSTVIGPIGFDANFGQGMDFDDADGTCYMCAFNNATFVAELRTVNLATGNTTLVGTLGAGLQQFGSCSSEAPGAQCACDLKILAADLSYDAGTRRLTVGVTVRNNGASPRTARLELDYNRNGGDPQGTRVLGMGTLPAGATVSRTINLRVPGGAPDGSYTLTLRLVDANSGCDCSQYEETVMISAPRVGGGGISGELFEVADVAEFSASAAGSEAPVVVAPNPFERQATLSYAVETPAYVRLAVYDALGREVAVLVDAPREAGTHTATFDAWGLAAGTYVWRLEVGGDVATGRLTIMR